jgi:ABC-type branched-subunit amino acid transport system ATPase component
VEHNRYVVEQCDRVVVLDDGVVIAAGAPEEIYGSEEVRAVYGEDTRVAGRT